MPTLITPRLKMVYGPYYQAVTPILGIKGQGNYFGVGGPGAGPRAVAGIVLTETTIQIRFSLCVTISANTGIQYRLNGGTWTTVSGRSGSDTTWVFTTATINPGDDVDWRYVGGSNSIRDCVDSEDIGNQQLNVVNPLVLAGDFVLLETGGMDIVLLEDDVAQEDGIKLENAV